MHQGIEAALRPLLGLRLRLVLGCLSLSRIPLLLLPFLSYRFFVSVQVGGVWCAVCFNEVEGGICLDLRL